VSVGSDTAVGCSTAGSIAGAVVGVAVLAQLAIKLNTIQIVKILKKIFITSSLQVV
jgi:hypothetical protein